MRLKAAVHQRSSYVEKEGKKAYWCTCGRHGSSRERLMGQTRSPSGQVQVTHRRFPRSVSRSHFLHVISRQFLYVNLNQVREPQHESNRTNAPRMHC